jgi:hypothetical protein
LFFFPFEFKEFLAHLQLFRLVNISKESGIFKCLVIGLSLVMGILTLMVGKRKHLYASILISAQCFKKIGDEPIKEVPSKRKKKLSVQP